MSIDHTSTVGVWFVTAWHPDGSPYGGGSITYTDDYDPMKALPTSWGEGEPIGHYVRAERFVKVDGLSAFDAFYGEGPLHLDNRSEIYIREARVRTKTGCDSCDESADGEVTLDWHCPHCDGRGWYWKDIEAVQ